MQKYIKSYEINNYSQLNKQNEGNKKKLLILNCMIHFYLYILLNSYQNSSNLKNYSEKKLNLINNDNILDNNISQILIENNSSILTLPSTNNVET